MWLNDTGTKIPKHLCNFLSFNSAPPGSAGQRGCESSQKRGVLGSGEHFAPIQKKAFGRVFTHVGKQLTEAVGRQNICSILLTAYLQIVLLSLGIITKLLWMPTETRTKTLGNIRPNISGVKIVLVAQVFNFYLINTVFQKKNAALHIAAERKYLILFCYFYFKYLCMSISLVHTLGQHFFYGMVDEI